MFWADRIVEEITKKFEPEIKAGQSLIIRDEKTMSGRVHVGSLRGVAIHGLVSELLTVRKIKNKYLFEINDFDPFDGLPHYLDRDKYLPLMGRPLKDVPATTKEFPNFAEQVADEFIKVINRNGFKPELYRLYPQYAEGKFNEVIDLALKNAGQIRKIYREISGSIKPDDWYPLQVVCQKCGRIGTTKVTNYDGKEVEYICEPALVKWATGCGNKGKLSPLDGNAKLPWKVEWAAKFKVFNVTIEGAGKDHATKGGSREISDTICREVFKYQPPFDIPYNFIVLGGKKMSSSKGIGATAKEVTDLMPPEIVRLLLFKNRPPQEVDFDPQGDTLPNLYDLHDKLSVEFFAKLDSDAARLFQLIYTGPIRNKLKKHFFPRFSLIAYLAQMPHINIEQEVAKMKGIKLTLLDQAELTYRVDYALNWLKTASPEQFRLTLYETDVPEQAKHLTTAQKKALRALAD